MFFSTMGKGGAIYSSNKCDESTRVSNLTAEGSPQSGGTGIRMCAALNAVGGCDVVLNAVVACLQRESSMIELVTEGSPCGRGPRVAEGVVQPKASHTPKAPKCRRLLFSAIFSQ
ncbi:unnamed protein product [Cuscuta epithymum]|uniref:Uncharacterized protein n=1 Tax=Cuscuta epithymum TaxID=186058 RepID=A0AAV0DHL8_9ASTE|nr:unnamed protein product [Cuscuta epithymum]